MPRPLRSTEVARDFLVLKATCRAAVPKRLMNGSREASRRAPNPL